MAQNRLELCMDGVVVVVETTLPGEWEDEQVADFATALVESGVAACAQRSRITSTYRWDGEMCDEPEWRLRLKTSESSLQNLVAALVAASPYTEPQVTHWRAHASEGYADWVDEQTG